MCTSGYYCPLGSGALGGSLLVKPVQCPPGSWCPVWTRVTQYAVGTDSYYAKEYVNTQGSGVNFLCGFGQFSAGNGNTGCTTCTAGMLCKTTGVSVPDACDAQYYCLAGDARPRLCDEGTLTVGTTAAD